MASVGNTLLSFGVAAWRQMLPHLQRVGAHFLNGAELGFELLLHIVWRPGIVMLRFVGWRVLRPLSRAWWRVVPAALALRCALAFGGAIFSTVPPPPPLAALGLLLGCFAVGVVAAILWLDVFRRTFNWRATTSQRRYVATVIAAIIFDCHSLLPLSAVRCLKIWAIHSTRARSIMPSSPRSSTCSSTSI